MCAVATDEESVRSPRNGVTDPWVQRAGGRSSLRAASALATRLSLLTLMFSLKSSLQEGLMVLQDWRCTMPGCLLVTSGVVAARPSHKPESCPGSQDQLMPPTPTPRAAQSFPVLFIWMEVLLPCMLLCRACATSRRGQQIL